MAYGKALQCLSDPTRRRVFEKLRSGPQSVGVLARGLPVSRPAVSQHLAVLRSVGLVTDGRVGRENRYRLCREPLDDIRNWLGQLDEFWASHLTRLREHLDANP